MKITSIKHRSAMLLPNLLTTTALLTAFYSLVATWGTKLCVCRDRYHHCRFLGCF